MDAFPQLVTTDNVVMLSIGTGMSVTNIPGTYHDWGLFSWAPYLVPLMCVSSFTFATRYCFEDL